MEAPVLGSFVPIVEKGCLRASHTRLRYTRVDMTAFVAHIILSECQDNLCYRKSWLLTFRLVRTNKLVELQTTHNVRREKATGSELTIQMFQLLIPNITRKHIRPSTKYLLVSTLRTKSFMGKPR